MDLLAAHSSGVNCWLISVGHFRLRLAHQHPVEWRDSSFRWCTSAGAPSQPHSQCDGCHLGQFLEKS
ncbi:hypothetical protein M5D96_002170 [Drosophila gunungcola]|uniref:Uncharacterized protein n=1 Tax=Drosophila gunungcola TaxID=103775 RepID=A0A9Q0BV89_9MUSC|nr:hypothetical protein M5D96_002170 [Drosophila gunungcola]